MGEVLHPENAEARGEGADAIQAGCGERGGDDDVIGDGEVAAVGEWGGGEGERWLLWLLLWLLLWRGS